MVAMELGSTRAPCSMIGSLAAARNSAGRLARRLGNRAAEAYFCIDAAVSAQLREGPEEHSHKIARRLVPLLTSPFYARRRANFRLLFPSKPGSQLHELRQEHLRYLARLQTHNARLAIETPDLLLRKIVAHGMDNLERVRALGRGVLIISGHTGTWWHVLGALAARRLQPTALANPALGRITRHMHMLATRYDVSVVDVGKDAHDLARSRFQSGNIVYLTIDVSVRPRQSRWTPLGPVELSMDPGPAIMALRQRVPVIWARSFHDDHGRSHVDFTPAIETECDPASSKVEDIMRHWLSLLWNDVQSHPAQWWAVNFIQLRPRFGPDRSAP